MKRKLKLFLLGLVITTNTTCSFWYGDKLVTCTDEGNAMSGTPAGAWYCDASDV